MKLHSCPVWLCIWQRNQEDVFQGGEDERVSVRGCTNFKVSVTAAVVRISRKNRSCVSGWLANEFPFVEISFTLSEDVSEERSGNTQVRKSLRCRCILAGLPRKNVTPLLNFGKLTLSKTFQARAERSQTAFVGGVLAMCTSSDCLMCASFCQCKKRRRYDDFS